MNTMFGFVAASAAVTKSVVRIKKARFMGVTRRNDARPIFLSLIHGPLPP
jgi:hypothetical protein